MQGSPAGGDAASTVQPARLCVINTDNIHMLTKNVRDSTRIQISGAQQCRHFVMCSQYLRVISSANGINRARADEKAPALVPVRAPRDILYCETPRSRFALEPVRFRGITYPRIGG